jgi:hypothetical protein
VVVIYQKKTAETYNVIYTRNFQRIKKAPKMLTNLKILKKHNIFANQFKKRVQTQKV